LFRGIPIMVFKEPKQPVKLLLRAAGEAEGGSAAPERHAGSVLADRQKLAAGLVDEIGDKVGRDIHFGKKLLVDSICENASDSMLSLLAGELRDRFVEEAAAAVTHVGAEARPVHATLSAVCASKMPGAVKALAVVAILRELNLELLAAKHAKSHVNVDKAVARLVQSKVDLLAKGGKDAEGAMGELAFSALRSAKEQEREVAASPKAQHAERIAKKCDLIANGVATYMDSSVVGEFTTHYGEKVFKPALGMLNEPVLDEFIVRDNSENKLPKLYARLHAQFFNLGGFGGPARVIEEVAGDTSIPDGRKFAVIIVSLFDLFTRIPEKAGPKEKREVATDRKLIKEIVGRWSLQDGKAESLAESLNDCMLIRSNVKAAIKVDVNRRDFFEKLSLRYYIPALLALHPGARKLLSKKAPGSVGADYTHWHGDLLSKGGYEIPAKFVTRVSATIEDAELQALTIAAVMKHVATLNAGDKDEKAGGMKGGRSREFHVGADPFFMAKGEKEGYDLIGKASDLAHKEGKEAARQMLRANYGV